jgi:hypothetical protein
MLKSKKTFQEEYDYLKSNIPTAIEDHDFKNLPLPPSMVEDLFGDSMVESDITQIDIDEFFNSFEFGRDYSENELFEKKKTRLENLELMGQINPKAPEILGCAYEFH